MSLAAEPGRWGYLALLRDYRAFRVLWLGRVTSLTGDWFNTIALYEAVHHLSSSALAITLVMVAKTLPMFVVMPIAGPLVDRIDRRFLLIASDLFRALVGLGLVLSYLLDWLPGLYAATVFMMLGTGLSVPTSEAALPMLVGARHIPAANALLGGTWSVMLALGAALGGLATATLGITASFLIDISTFLFSAGLLARLPRLPAPAREAPGREEAPGAGQEEAPRAGQGEASFLDGVRYLVRSPYALALALLKPMMQINGGLSALLPLYGTVVFRDASGAIYVGLLYAARGVGAVVGSFFVRAIFGDRVVTLRRLIWFGYLSNGLACVALAACTAYWQALLAYLLMAAGRSLVWVFSGSLIQIEVDQRFHGRVFSIVSGTAMLALAGSSFLAGVVIDHGLSLSRAVLGFAGIAAIPVVSWGAALWRIRLGARRGRTT